MTSSGRLAASTSDRPACNVARGVPHCPQVVSPASEAPSPDEADAAVAVIVALFVLSTACLTAAAWRLAGLTGALVVAGVAAFIAAAVLWAANR